MDGIARISQEFLALSELRDYVVGLLDSLDGVTLTEAGFRQHFGITRTVLRQLVATGKVHCIRNSRRKGAWRRYPIKDVLTAVLNGQPATRLRSRKRARPENATQA